MLAVSELYVEPVTPPPLQLKLTPSNENVPDDGAVPPAEPRAGFSICTTPPSVGPIDLISIL